MIYGHLGYPVLQAADILIYRSNLVPVGRDQVQHIEMTQDMAGYFNNTYGEVFVRPEPRLNAAMTIPGVDGRKMSKSYDNTIAIFDPPKAARKKIMSIKTDSTPVELSEAYGIPVDALEAVAFAVLGWCASRGEPGNLPGATGACHPAILGTATPPGAFARH